MVEHGEGLEDELFGGLDEVENVLEEFLELGVVDPLEDVEEDGLNALAVGEDIDVEGDRGEEAVVVVEVEATFEAFLIKPDG